MPKGLVSRVHYSRRCEIDPYPATFRFSTRFSYGSGSSSTTTIRLDCRQGCPQHHVLAAHKRVVAYRDRVAAASQSLGKARIASEAVVARGHCCEHYQEQ